MMIKFLIFNFNNKKFLLTFLIIFILLLNSNSIKAEDNLDNQLNQLIYQIQILEKQIQELQKLINLFSLQKDITADGYLVTNLNNNLIILEKNSQKIYPIASITKLMNAVIVVENINLNQNIVLTKEMLEPEGYSPSLFLGLKINAENLLKASLIQSTNDAANALSYFLGKEKFLNLMKEKAKELEMNQTNFADPHGLDAKNYSTANDLIKLLRYIYQNHPNLLTITKENNFWLPNSVGRWLKFKNLNIFYEIPEFIGGKVGRSPKADLTFAGIFKINQQPIAIVLLKSKNIKKDVLAILNWFEKN